jgi:hypothetical protein
VGPGSSALAERPDQVRFLIRDHDRKFSRCFDDVIEGAGISYDLHPDGKRLAAAAAQASGVQDKVVFVFNFADFLRTIAPGTK